MSLASTDASTDYDAQTLAAVLEQALSEPGSVIGQRLRPEEELAALFQVGRWRMRASIKQLVDKGILVRRRGSGTYIRKAPTPPTRTPSGPAVAAAQILATDNDSFAQPAKLHATVAQRQLHLGLWGDLHCTSTLNQSILANIAERAGQTGHRLAIHSLVERENVALAPHVLAARIQRSACDGYIIVHRWASNFLSATDVARQTPRVFMSPGGRDIQDLQPMVFINTFGATEQALGRLLEQGYQRIGMIGQNGDAGERASQLRTYQRVLAEAGLDYRAATFCGLSVIQSMQALRQLLRRDPPPQAIYVADNYLMVGIAEAMAIDRIVPGRDLAVITHNNRGHVLPPEHNWSCMQFDLQFFAYLIVDTLIRCIETPNAPMGNVALQAIWKPGDTHQPPVRQQHEARRLGTQP